MMENLENLRIISEDILKREKAVKHFSLSDGSMLAVVHSKNIEPTETMNIDASKIEDAYVSSEKPGDNYSESEFIKVGKEPGGGMCSSFLKFTGLPKLNKGEMITEAKLRLFTPPDKVPAQGKQIKLKQVVGSWNQSDITSNNAPETKDFIQDVQISDGQNNQFTWDITRALKEWYELPDVNKNYGVKLYADEDDTDGIVEFVSADRGTNPEYDGIRPRILVRYKNYVGEEPYWSYSEHSAGVYGIGMVNNYAGNLVIRENLLTSSGLRLPISVQNTYNSLNYNEYCNTSVYKNVYKDGYVNSSPSGLGWRLNFNQLLFPLAAHDKMNSESKHKFVFVDADGTQHHFVEIFNEDIKKYQLVDEDGLGFELVVESDDVQKIKDKLDNTMVFERTIDCSVLKKVIDNKNNVTIFNYEWVPSSDGKSKQYKVSKITDAAGRKVEINYQPDGLVSSIIGVDGRGTYLQYNEKQLIGITYPDGLKTSYGYDGEGRLCEVSSSVGTGGSCIKYTYLSDGVENSNFTKISKVTGYGSLVPRSEAEGYSLEFSYNPNNTTTVTQTNPNKGTSYEAISQTFSFDNSGRAVSILNDDGSASSCKYYKETTATDKSKNKITQISSQKHFVNNLLLNHGAEDGVNNWIVKDTPESEFAADAPAVTADTEEHKIGETSFKISKNSDSPMKPCAVQKVSIPAAETGKSYTFSAYVKQNSDDVSEDVAEIFITPFRDAEKLSEPARKEISGLQKGKWTKVFVTMDVAKGTDVLEVGFGLVKSNCTVYFDCLQLEEGDVANDYNLLENSGFDKELSYWKASGFGENDGVIGGRLRINGDISTRKSASQTVKINMKNPVFCVNARAEAQSLPFTERDGKTAGFNVSLDFLYEDNSHDTKIIKFNPEILSKQSICDSAQAGNGSFKDKIVKSVTVSLNYDHNENSASFDDIQLSLDDAGSRYSYDESGNIESILDPSDNQTLVEMTENNEIHSITSPKGYASTIEYSSKNPHIPIKSTNPLPDKQLLMTSYEYDKFHNVTKVVASPVGQSSRIIEQNFSYTSDGNYPKSITDVFGNTVQYSYNQRNGDLTSVTDAKGNIVHYEYDRVGRLVKTKNNSSVYGTKYKNGAVSSIFHNNDEQSNVVYNFSYDDFGNIDKISVGDQALTENTYDAHNGLLRKSTYGNGDSVLFDYDKYERLVGKTCTKSQGESKEYTYSYNSNGLPFAINDKSRSETINFEYDTADRLTKKTYSNGTELDYKYDESNIVNERSLKSEMISFNTTDKFGQQGRLTNSKVILNGVETSRDLCYDNIGRLESVISVQTGSGQDGGVRHRLAYIDVPGTNKTSTLIKSVTCEKSTATDVWGGLGVSYSYEYDANYNITKIFENGTEKISYAYDEQNQLVRENNALIGKTVTYEYDFGGNILSKKEYAYTTGNVEEAQNEITYAYADENWKDKLTGFNGETFTYDGIGNPLTYRDGLTMTWTEGRKLERISKSGLDVSFEYGVDGVRRKKTVNGIVTEFITDGIKILAQKTGDRVLTFLTDGNGDTYGFVLNEVARFYLKNLQGDVIGITDAAGNIEAKYTYDTWGKLVSITDSEGNNVTENPDHIGFINPIRYRGYYYDSETGLYYLNARYYDPETSRFLNADAILKGGHNLFRYCYNNPINWGDWTGYDPHGPGYKFRTLNVWTVFWDAAEYVQTKTLSDPDDVEYGFVVYEDFDAEGYFCSYDVERGLPGSGNVSFTRLIDTYLSTDGGKKCRCPDRLFGHTHGKDPRNGIHHYNVYSGDDIKHANLNGIQMALIPPNGIVQMFDARFGPKEITDAYKMSPPSGVNIPRDEYYTGIMGPLRRWLARAEYL